jgi:hypothetical protein
VWASRFDSARKRQRPNVPGRAGELHQTYLIVVCALTKPVPQTPTLAVSEYIEFARMLTEQAPFAWKQVRIL